MTCKKVVKKKTMLFRKEKVVLSSPSCKVFPTSQLLTVGRMDERRTKLSEKVASDLERVSTRVETTLVF